MSNLFSERTILKMLFSATLITTASLHGIATAGDDTPVSQGFFDGEWRTSLGIGAASLPRYEGSDQQRWRALPLIDIRYGRFFLGIGGLGVDLSTVENLQFGPRLSYRTGRDAGDSAHLQGLGTISSGAEAGLFLRRKIGAAFIHGNINTPLGNAAKGVTAQLGGVTRCVSGQPITLLLTPLSTGPTATTTPPILG